MVSMRPYNNNNNMNQPGAYYDSTDLVSRSHNLVIEPFAALPHVLFLPIRLQESTKTKYSTHKIIFFQGPQTRE